MFFINTAIVSILSIVGELDIGRLVKLGIMNRRIKNGLRNKALHKRITIRPHA